jgi:hypothetical protein
MTTSHITGKAMEKISGLPLLRQSLYNEGEQYFLKYPMLVNYEQNHLHVLGQISHLLPATQNHTL